MKGIGRLVLAAVVSAALHAGGSLALGGWMARSESPHPRMLPIEVKEAPAVPEPPKPPVAAPPPSPQQQPPPPPRPPKPKPRPRVKPTAAEGVAVIADAGPTPDAPTADPVADGVVPDALVGDGSTELADAGSTDAAPILIRDAGLAPKIDPAVVDLRSALPPGARVMLALRTDRMRGTLWAAPLEAVLAPMPDYRSLVAGTGLPIAETFETVVVSSAQPRDVTQTFLAARTNGDEVALRRALARGTGGTPRIAWTTVAGGSLGRRLDPMLAKIGDPRIVLGPMPGWFLMVRPEQVEGLLQPTPAEPISPAWLEPLGRIETQTGDALAVLVLADPGVPRLVLPGLAPLPAPDRLTVAVTVESNGLVLTGAAVFADEALAQAFHDSVLALQQQALGSLGRRLLLRSFSADGAVGRLRLARHETFVTFSTSVTVTEALALLDQAAQMARAYFDRGRNEP